MVWDYREDQLWNIRNNSGPKTLPWGTPRALLWKKDLRFKAFLVLKNYISTNCLKSLNNFSLLQAILILIIFLTGSWKITNNFHSKQKAIQIKLRFIIQKHTVFEIINKIMRNHYFQKFAMKASTRNVYFNIIWCKRTFNLRDANNSV